MLPQTRFLAAAMLSMIFFAGQAQAQSRTEEHSIDLIENCGDGYEAWVNYYCPRAVNVVSWVAGFSTSWGDRVADLYGRIFTRVAAWKMALIDRIVRLCIRIDPNSEENVQLAADLAKLQIEEARDACLDELALAVTGEEPEEMQEPQTE